MVVVSLVERGWQAAREASLDLGSAGCLVVHLIKGRLTGDERALIAPRPHIRVVGIPRRLFWPVAAGFAVWLRLRGRLALILVDNARSRRRVAGWGAGRIAIVRQEADRYVVETGEGAVSPEAWASGRALGCAWR